MASCLTAVDSGNDGGADSLMAQGKAYERGNDFARAIETYLSLSTADTNNVDVLQQCWEQVSMGFTRNMTGPHT